MSSLQKLCNLLSSALHGLDSHVHGEASPILWTSWDPSELAQTAPVSYIQDKESMKQVPVEHLSPEIIPEKGDFWLLFTPRSYRSILGRRAQEPEAPDMVLVMQMAIYHVWEKVQWNQEKQKPKECDLLQLLFSAEEIFRCAEGKSKMSLELIEHKMKVEYENMWDAAADYFTKTYGGELFGKWRCWRSVEAMTVAAVGVNLKKVDDSSPSSAPSFLRRLKQLADAKIRYPA